MAEIFGDQVDAEEVLARHGEVIAVSQRQDAESHHEKPEYA